MQVKLPLTVWGQANLWGFGFLLRDGVVCSGPFAISFLRATSHVQLQRCVVRVPFCWVFGICLFPVFLEACAAGRSHA